MTRKDTRKTPGIRVFFDEVFLRSQDKVFVEFLLFDGSDECLKDIGVLYGEFGEHFSVEFDILLFFDIDEPSIGESVLAQSIVEADDPETAE